MDLDSLPFITFFADRHSYNCRTVDFTSATTLVGKYKWEFQREYWLTSGAIKGACPKVWRNVKDEKYKGQRKPSESFFWDCFHAMSAKQITETKRVRKDLEWQWEMKNAVACLKGTRFHLKMEQKDVRSKKGIKNPFTGVYQKIVQLPDTESCDNGTITNDLSKLEDGYYPELLIFYYIGGVGICGQVDRAWIWTDDGGVRHYCSDDWKTNWAKKDLGGRETFKSFLRHLRTTKDTEYSLQASIYAYMMELAGYNVAGIQITYINNFDNKEIDRRTLPYLKEEVSQMFDKFFENE